MLIKRDMIMLNPNTAFTVVNTENLLSRILHQKCKCYKML